jgi:serine/threonine protein kinase
MGVVYRARRLDLGREVALKTLVPGGWSSAQDARRLRRDASTAATLEHPHIVRVYDVGEYRGLPFFEMELIAGGNLSQKLPEAVGAPRAAARLVAQAARALDYAHHRGVCHRDVKPANIMLRVRHRSGLRNQPGAPPAAPAPPALDDLDACVTDFGLARRTRGESGLTLDGTVVGTPGYAAPEQIRAEEPSPAADVYGLGAVLYECLTGQPPFRGTTPFDTLLLTLQGDVVRPRVLNHRLPRDLETVCLKALEYEPGRRYASAAALADDLERWLGGESVLARRVGPLGRGWRWCRRKPLVPAFAAALVVAVACGLVASLWMWRKAAGSEARALTGEALARTSLRQEEEARRDAEEQYARLRTTLSTSVLSISSTTFAPVHDTPRRLAMLRETESSLDRLLARQPRDPQLRAMLARVLTLSGAVHYSDHRTAECVATFERAAGLWDQLRDADARMPQNRGWRAIAYVCLEQAHDRAGRPDRAQPCFEAAVRVWRDLIKDDPGLANQEFLYPAAADVRWLLIGSGYAEADVTRRFGTIRERLDRMGGGDERDFTYGFLRLYHLLTRAVLYLQTGHREGLLTTAREAAGVLADALRRPSLHRNDRLWSVDHSVRVCLWLRRAGAPDEALRLAEAANRTIRELLRDAPADGALLAALSQSWHAIGKIHWDLRQAEECLAACREAVEAQSRALELLPTATQTRSDLGARYTQLGRKLCELGRLDEAEACFATRQGLWPGDAGRHAEALGELRKWAAEVVGDGTEVSSEARHRYLELCSRLERKGVTPGSQPGARR